MKCCPACGQSLPDLKLLQNENIRFSAGERRILAAALRAGTYGIEADALFDRLYSDDPDGGPLTGKQTLQVRIYLLNRKLRPHGKELRAKYGTYKFVDTKRIRHRGERVLRPATVEKIRLEYTKGLEQWEAGTGPKITQEALARKYGVTQAHISTVVRYRDRSNAPYWGKVSHP